MSGVHREFLSSSIKQQSDPNTASLKLPCSTVQSINWLPCSVQTTPSQLEQSNKDNQMFKSKLSHHEMSLIFCQINSNQRPVHQSQHSSPTVSTNPTSTRYTQTPIKIMTFYLKRKPEFLLVYPKDNKKTFSRPTTTS